MAKWLPPAVLALGFAVISPSLWSGWTGDDAFYSALDGILGADKITLWQAMRHSFDVWFFGNGRFYPGLIVEKYLVFSLFTDLVAYKLFLIVATLAAVEMFRRCVQAYTTPAFGLFCALMVVILFLERGYQDPVLAYNAMPQFVAIAMLGSLIAFRKALVEDRTGMAALSLILYTAAALTYEDVYALCVLYPVLAWFVGRSPRRAARAGLPYVALAIGLGIFSLALRAWVRLPPDSMYALNLSAPSVLSTAFDQVTAAWPLSYWLVNPPAYLSASSIAALLRGAPFFPLVFAAFALTCWAALGAAGKDVNVRPVFWIAAIVMLLPALPVAIIVKYQHELRLGLGYLPVFFQIFGVALLLAGLAVLAMRSRFRTPWKMAIVLVAATLGTITQVANVAMVSADQSSKAARIILQRQISMGLMNAVPQGSAVGMPRRFEWIDYDDQGPDGISTRGLFYMFGRRRIDLVPPGDARARFLLRYDARAGLWSLRRLHAYAAPEPLRPCNTFRILNGDFSSGFVCWARVAVSPGRFSGFPKFSINASGMCLPAPEAGNPLASIDVAGNAEGYIAQAFMYRGSPTRVTFRTWGTIERVKVTVGIVFPVGTGIGREKVLDSFIPPSVQVSAATCSGLHPITKSYSFSGFKPGTQIELRLHATSSGSNGAIVNFDHVTSSP